MGLSGYSAKYHRSKSDGSKINGLMLDWIRAMAKERLSSVESTLSDRCHRHRSGSMEEKNVLLLLSASDL